MEDAVEPTSYPMLFEVVDNREGQFCRHLTLVQADGKRSVCLGGLPIYVYDTDDKAAEAVCIAMLSSAELASDVAIAKAFGCHRNTVGRLARRLAAQGMAAVVPARRGPRSPHKVTPDIIEIIRAESSRMNVPTLARFVKQRTGVTLSPSHVRRLARSYKPVALELAFDEEPAQTDAEKPLSHGEGPDAGGEASPEIAVGIDFGEEPLRPASVGLSEPDAGLVEETQGFDPPAVLPEHAAGRYMGLALYFPAIKALGLMKAAHQVFSLPRSIVFGVRAVTLSLLFMTLLRKPTVESAKHLRRPEFGALVGTDRAPCVKTLRRKLDGLAAQVQAAEFGRRLARQWVEAGILATRYLYVDGHMKVYTGKRRLQEFYNSQRRLAISGVHAYFVGDRNGRPLLYVNEKLPAYLGNAVPDIVVAIRQVVGKRKFTLIFDRGGFDHKLFMWLDKERIGFVTYQQGSPNLPESIFSRREARFEGRRIRFDMAEDNRGWVNGRGPWRRVVVRAKDGRQIPIITNLRLRAPLLACLMVVRWRQENFFKYMDAHYGLDHLISYGAEEADPRRSCPTPSSGASSAKYQSCVNKPPSSRSLWVTPSSRRTVAGVSEF